MATISKAITDTTVRTAAFKALNIDAIEDFKRISNQSYGIVFTDDNGTSRLVEIKAIATSLKTMEEMGMTAEELLDFEAQEYQREIEEKAAKKKQKAEEAARKKAEREAKKKKKEEE